MTIAEMKHHFTHRELGIQGAVGEYAILVPLAQWEGKLCLLFETGRRPWWATSRGGLLPRGPAGEGRASGGNRPPGDLGGDRDSPEVRFWPPWMSHQDISDRVVYPFLGTISPQGVDRLAASAAEVKNVFFVPLDYLMHYPEEVYRYTVSAQVDDQFPYERMGFPKNYPWRTGFMDVPIYEYEGPFYLGNDRPTVHGCSRSCGRWKGKGELWSRWNFWAGTGLPNRTPVLSWAGTACCWPGFAPCAPGGRCVTWAVGWAPSCFCCPSGRRPWTGWGVGAGPCRGRPGPAEPVGQRLGGTSSYRRPPGPHPAEGRPLPAGDCQSPLFSGGVRQVGGTGPDGRHLPGGRPVPGGRAFGQDRGAFRSGLPPRAAGGALCRPSGGPTGAKQLQLLSYGPSSPPYAVLVEAVKEGGPGLEILPVHYQTESAH